MDFTHLVGARFFKKLSEQARVPDRDTFLIYFVSIQIPDLTLNLAIQLTWKAFPEKSRPKKINFLSSLVSKQNSDLTLTLIQLI